MIINDPLVSRWHAEIRFEEEVFVLYDMGSSNGTFVGDKESYKAEENRKYRHPLEDGQYILLGETTLVFKTL